MTRIIALVGLFSLVAQAASAQEPPDAEAGGQEVAVSESEEPADPAAHLGHFVIGVGIGPSFSAFSDLGVSYLPRLTLGYNLPVWGRRIDVFATASYTSPSAEGNVTDSRLPETGTFHWELTQQEATVGIGARIRLFELGRFVNPYAAIAPQIAFLRSKVNGESNEQSFGENTEETSAWGLYGALGVELVLGPGSAFFELGLNWSDLDVTVTGDSNTGNLSPMLGYRFML